MNKIMFVCTGNTCRSAMAELIFKDLLKKNGIEDFKITSSGLFVSADTINPQAKATLKKMNIKIGRFKPKMISKRLLKNQNAIICMTRSQKQELIKHNNVYTLDELTFCGDIPDPFGGNSADYEHIAQLLKKELEKLLKILMEK